MFEASTKNQTESNSVDTHSRPRMNQLLLLGVVLQRNTSFRRPRWHERAAHSYADDLAHMHGAPS